MRIDAAKVLVTGAGGFLGAHLARTLHEQGARVLAWVRPGGDPWRLQNLGGLVLEAVDLRDTGAIQDALERARPSAILHAAKANAPRGDVDPQQAHAINVRATRGLLEWAETRGVEAFVQLGSATEYAPSEAPLHEASPIAPLGVHGRTKAEASRLLLEASARGLPGVLLRIFNAYGPWDRPGRFLPTVIRAVRSGTPLELTRRGLCRDWIHVDDVVDLCLRCLRSPLDPGEVFNVGTGTMLANEEIVAAVEGRLGRRAVLLEGAHPERPWDRGCWLADPSRAKERLGWEPRWPFPEGLDRMIRREVIEEGLHA